MIAHKSTSDRGNEVDDDPDPDSRSRSAAAGLTNLELRIGSLKLPPMWEVRDLAVKLRLPATTGPYASAVRLLVVLLAVLALIVLASQLAVP